MWAAELEHGIQHRIQGGVKRLFIFVRAEVERTQLETLNFKVYQDHNLSAIPAINVSG